MSGPRLAIMIRCLLVMKAFAHKGDTRKRTGGQKRVCLCEGVGGGGALGRSAASRV